MSGNRGTTSTSIFCPIACLVASSPRLHSHFHSDEEQSVEMRVIAAVLLFALATSAAVPPQKGENTATLTTEPSAKNKTELPKQAKSTTEATVSWTTGDNATSETVTASTQLATLLPDVTTPATETASTTLSTTSVSTSVSATTTAVSTSTTTSTTTAPMTNCPTSPTTKSTPSSTSSTSITTTAALTTKKTTPTSMSTPSSTSSTSITTTTTPTSKKTTPTSIPDIASSTNTSWVEHVELKGEEKADGIKGKEKRSTRTYALFLVPLICILIVCVSCCVYCGFRKNPELDAPPGGTSSRSSTSRRLTFANLGSPKTSPKASKKSQRASPQKSTKKAIEKDRRPTSVPMFARPKSPQKSVHFSLIMPMPKEPLLDGPDLSPIHIPGESFKFKGPMVRDQGAKKSLPQHRLDDPKLKARAPKTTDHIVFDDNLNEIHEIGSEVEIFVNKSGNTGNRKSQRQNSEGRKVIINDESKTGETTSLRNSVRRDPVNERSKSKRSKMYDTHMTV
ncbi:hypothetical protein L596_009125 [Steinernema carpocapsae]|uniref:Uncharacterized protein n=1 Tax=Steinernema carpocapsae TaxID=34508 RepID=A0A4U5PEZ9_STECR|nr:hypothetical protein L596_009125 [Steinernema carpocapsae]